MRHPQYLELPWDIHWYPSLKQQRHPWWLIILLVLLALLTIGVGGTSGLP
ncbi:MAG TPA: hypothetical protein VG453_09575 [Nitrospira sp.]|jgi:hypothetical protein|nr:hypothetical protein [Nitrospira sp.]